MKTQPDVDVPLAQAQVMVNGKPAHLRRAVSTDAERICRMHKASIRDVCRSHYTPEQIQAWADPKRPEHYEPLLRDSIVCVVEVEGEIAGFGALDSSAAEIHALYVAPEFIGRGVGSAILGALESEALRLGRQRLSVSATLNGAGFYSARGYSLLGPAKNVLPQGMSIPCVRMEKTLTN